MDTGGAGDQGLVFGYATDETPELMPLPIILAHKLMQRHAELRTSGSIPDAKSQVTVRYHNDRPVGVETVVLSTQHDSAVPIDTVRAVVEGQIIQAVILNSDFKILINPTGRFVVGGPHGDTGLTGRKIIVDTMAADALMEEEHFQARTRVRLTALLRMLPGMSLKILWPQMYCTDRLCYRCCRTGVADDIDTHGAGNVDERAISEVFDLTPAGIIQSLNLRRPIYAQTAAYGHFGRDFTWERCDRVDQLHSCCHQGIAGRVV